MPLVSFIILEYKSLHEVQGCVDSIAAACKGIAHECIVTSNSQYTAEEQQRALQEVRGVKWLFNERNGGFAAGMNCGLAAATGEYMMMCSSDVRLQEGFMDMLTFAQAHQEIGVIGPQLVDEDGNVQDSCRQYVTLQDFIYRQLKRIVSHKEIVRSSHIDYTKVQYIDWLVGGCVMLSREAYRLTGGFDESFFMYAEDMDLCVRVSRLGYRVCYYPLAKVQFRGSRRARHSAKYAAIFIKSHLHLWHKHGFFRCSK